MKDEETRAWKARKGKRKLKGKELDGMVELIAVNLIYYFLQ